MYKPENGIFKSAVNSGYITSYMSTGCHVHDFHKTSWLPVEGEQADHVFTSCDSNYMLRGDYWNQFSGFTAFTRRCTYGENVHSQMFRYSRSFLELYPEHPVFLRLFFMENHEPTSETVGIIDEELAQFITHTMVETRQDHGKMLILMSDHGHHFHPIFRPTNLANIELHSPLLTIVTNKFFPWDSGKFLRFNANSLVSAFDIHTTLMKLLSNFDNPEKDFNGTIKGPGYNLLYDYVPRNRTCKHASIPSLACQCKYKKHDKRINL